MNINPRKAAIVGCGSVGASIAFRFLQQGLFSHLVLLDANRDKAEGEAMDLSDGLPYGAAMEITAGTKTPDTLSAILAMGALVAAASLTIRMIWDRVVSSPTRVA